MEYQTKQYLTEIFGSEPEIAPLKNNGRLPLIITGNYDFNVATINSTPFVLMVDRKKSELSPGQIQKQSKFAERLLNRKTVYVTDQLPAYQRKRLVERRVQFIVPGKQLFMPFIGVALCEDNEKQKKYDHLPICAQEILLMVINGIIPNEISIKDLLVSLPYSRQTTTVSIDALETFALTTKVNKGRSKILRFPKDHSFFDKVIPLLSNPVSRIVGVDSLPADSSATDAGTTLLSRRTLLAESSTQEMALSLSNFNKIKHSINILPVQDAPIALQVWFRSPLLPGCSEIDNISLYLSMKDDPDERVQISLNELIKDIR